MNKPDDLPLTPQTLARHFIGNAWVRSAKGLTLPVVDPANGQVLAATARYFEYYAGACDKLAGEVLPFAPAYTVMALRVPFGVTGHIVPWNYPSQIFGRSVGASLAAGNACVLKPPEDASLALLEIA